jgi:acetyl-CoA C-acetyltransferase
MSSDRKEVIIASAVRTPIGSFGGSLKEVTAVQLGATAIKGALDKAGIRSDLVTDVYMGCVIASNLGQAPARQAARLAGLPDQVNCTLVNKVCASGLKAVMLAAQSIALGEAEVVIAGGMESMSNVPFYVEQLRWGNKFGNTTLIDGLSRDGLTDAYDGQAMGMAAERCAATCAISREEQDAFAIESYRRSQQAWEKGLFHDEIVPVEIRQRNGESKFISKDEEPFTVKFEKIPVLKPAFKPDGTVTAANASTLNDGAAALLLMSSEKAQELGINPLAIIKGYADAEQAPEWFTTTPALALPIAIGRAGLTTAQIDFWEINEAFSVVGIENSRRLDIDVQKVNVHGGAVSLGHPLGASGARILVTLLNVLVKNKGRFGAAGICNGGGGASALVVENLR